MKYIPLFMLCLFLGACSAADGKWPSLMTTKPAGSAVAVPDPAFAAVPIIETSPTVAPVALAQTIAVQPLAARLEQEQRGLAFALERLTDQRTALTAAQWAAQGQATKSAAALGAKAAQKKMDGLQVDLGDQQFVVLGIISEIAMIAPSPARDDVLRQGGTLLLALDNAFVREGIKPVVSVDSAEAIFIKFDADKAKWQLQNKALQKSLAQVKVRGPEDAAWNAAQIDVTRMSQAAKTFSTSAQALEIYLGKLVRDFASGAVNAPAINAVATQLREIVAAENDNFAQLQGAREQLEPR